MKRTILALALAVGLPMMAFGQANSACNGWLAPEGAGPRTCVTVSTFTNVVTLTTVERSVNIGAEAARIVSITVASTNCANFDLVIADTSCTIAGGTCSVANTAQNLIFEDNAILAHTFYGTAYSQYLYHVPQSPIAVTPTFDATTNERLIYVRGTNGDASSDDDITVTIVWES